jgi:hypothetical protein
MSLYGFIYTMAPVIALCGFAGAIVFILSMRSAAHGCDVCGSPTVPGENLCAIHRTAGTLAGQTYEEWAADRTTPVIWRRF